MTDIELLPLPEADDSVENRAQWPIVIDSDVWLQESVQSYARAVAEHNVAARDAEIERMRAEREVIGAEAVKYADKSGRLEAKVERLTEALRIAEAALADIGDADREPGDDVSWCERRAALGLRVVRDVLRDHDQEAPND